MGEEMGSILEQQESALIEVHIAAAAAARKHSAEMKRIQTECDECVKAVEHRAADVAQGIETAALEQASHYETQLQIEKERSNMIREEAWKTLANVKDEMAKELAKARTDARMQIVAIQESTCKQLQKVKSESDRFKAKIQMEADHDMVNLQAEADKQLVTSRIDFDQKYAVLNRKLVSVQAHQHAKQRDHAKEEEGRRHEKFIGTIRRSYTRQIETYCRSKICVWRLNTSHECIIAKRLSKARHEYHFLKATVNDALQATKVAGEIEVRAIAHESSIEQKRQEQRLFMIAEGNHRRYAFLARSFSHIRSNWSLARLAFTMENVNALRNEKASIEKKAAIAAATADTQLQAVGTAEEKIVELRYIATEEQKLRHLAHKELETIQAQQVEDTACELEAQRAAAAAFREEVSALKVTVGALTEEKETMLNTVHVVIEKNEALEACIDAAEARVVTSYAEFNEQLAICEADHATSVKKHINYQEKFVLAAENQMETMQENYHITAEEAVIQLKSVEDRWKGTTIEMQRLKQDSRAQKHLVLCLSALIFEAWCRNTLTTRIWASFMKNFDAALRKHLLEQLMMCTNKAKEHTQLIQEYQEAVTKQDSVNEKLRHQLVVAKGNQEELDSGNFSAEKEKDALRIKLSSTMHQLQLVSSEKAQQQSYIQFQLQAVSTWRQNQSIFMLRRIIQWQQYMDMLRSVHSMKNQSAISLTWSCCHDKIAAHDVMKVEEVLKIEHRVRCEMNSRLSEKDVVVARKDLEVARLRVLPRTLNHLEGVAAKKKVVFCMSLHFHHHRVVSVANAKVAHILKLAERDRKTKISMLLGSLLCIFLGSFVQFQLDDGQASIRSPWAWLNLQVGLFFMK